MTRDSIWRARRKGSQLLLRHKLLAAEHEDRGAGTLRSEIHGCVQGELGWARRAARQGMRTEQDARRRA
jgi:hypothetical protein